MAKRDQGFRRIPPPRPPPTGTELCGPDHGVGLVRVEDALRRFDAAWVAAMDRERRKTPAPASVRGLQFV